MDEQRMYLSVDVDKLFFLLLSFSIDLVFRGQLINRHDAFFFFFLLVLR